MNSIQAQQRLAAHALLHTFPHTCAASTLPPPPARSSSNFLGMTNLMSAMAVVAYERVVFYREQGSSMYDAFAYGIAIAVVEIPYLLVQTLMFVPIM